MVQRLEHLEPGAYGSVRGADVLLQRVHREQGADALGQEIGEHLEPREIRYRAQVAHVLVQQALEAQPAPALGAAAVGVGQLHRAGRLALPARWRNDAATS